MPIIRQPIKVILAVLWTAFIIYVLTKEPSGIPKFKWLALPGVDKIIHAILFFVEAGLICLSWTPPIERKRGFVIFGFCVVLGGVLELIQYEFVDGRSGDTIDLFADAFGAFLAVWSFSIVKKRG